MSSTSLQPKIPSFRYAVVRTLKALKISKLVHHLYYDFYQGFEPSSPYLLPALDDLLARVKEEGAGGDYLEFGVFKGYALWYAQNKAEELGIEDMRFFGFDSFEGLPDPTGIDRTKRKDFYRGQYRCGRERVEANLTERGIDWSKTFLVEGYFSDTLTPELRDRHDIERVAIAVLDCDLYSSTKEALDFLAPLLGDGSILVFDDWNCFDARDDRGQRRAFGEFREDHPEFDAEQLFSYGHWSTVFRLQRRPE